MAINLQKVTLRNSGDTHSINLTKSVPSSKEVIINLNWSQPPKKNLLSKLFSSQSDIDLDLGIFYELNDGTKNCIDGLQFSKGQGGTRDRVTKQGSYTNRPWIWHSGDDRGVSAGSGENILINPTGLNEIKRLVVYCFIYEGVAQWSQTNAVVTIKVSDNPDIEIEMGAMSSSKKFCVLAEVTLNSGSMQVQKKVTFHDSHQGCDRAYNWGMKWIHGSK